MRSLGKLLSTLVALSLLTGCTTTQVKEASGGVAGALLGMTVDAALDVALDGPERRERERQRRNSVPGSEWNPCLRACELARENALNARHAEAEARKRRIEAKAFRAEFDAFMQNLEATEQRSADLPSIMLNSQ